MKKTLLLTLALLLSMITFAQSRLSYISEHFDSEDFPAGWTFEGEGTGNWQIWGTHQAGGEPNEIKLYWKPSFEGVARLVSPAINLTGVSEMVVSFKAFLDNYQNVPHKMGVATTSDNGTTWNIAWQNTYDNSNQGQHSIIETISTADMGKENVKFCIFFDGASGNMNGWYFDDIEIYTLDKLNIGIMSIDIPEIAGATDNAISFTVKNTGEETVTSFSASYKIDDNETVTQNFETKIEPLQETQITFEEKVDLLPGSHNLTINILDVNGEEDVTADNVKTSEINIAISTAERRPMIEHFSSPTCAPCVAVNQQMVLLTEKHHNQYTYTKYPANFPQEGDPYYTDECKVRKTYYNVNAAPTLFLDGDLYGNTFIIEQDFEKAHNTPAYIDIKGAFNVNKNDSTINISVDIMPFVNLYQKRVFVSVNEKTTTENASYNGETEFHHIMMKMFPDAEGTEIDLKAGELQHFEFSYDMNETYMEELNDLEVAVWVQDYLDYIIYNSNYAYEYTSHPYPAQNLQLAYNEEDKSLVATWEQPEVGNPIGYNFYINDKLMAENISELSYTMENAFGLLVAKVVAIYENEMTSVSAVNTIVTEDNTISINENTISLNLYPNPVGDVLFLATEIRVEEVSIYDIYGRTVRQQVNMTTGQQVVEVADLENGIYFINIKTDKGNIVRRFIKN
ncbi:MAG: T9SS type A sorting domain-containing protein [Bacteroidales bacterium]|nr:T9SS type A sorting domain-containing protein [Bacteroidales bacterium]